MTDTAYWDATWQAVRLPRLVSFDHHANRRLDDLFTRYLPDRRGGLIVEVGCAPGSWLIYFHERWNMTATGIESSPVGAEMTRRNATATKTPIRVLETDLFDASIRERFDVVWSAGLVEHFDDIATPLARLRELLLPGGLLITAVPNFNGSVYEWAQRRVNRAVLDVHRVVSPADLSRAYLDVGLEVAEAGYFGTWNLEVVNFTGHRKSQVWANRIDRLTGRALGAVHARRESRLLSPYVAAVGRAPA